MFEKTLEKPRGILGYKSSEELFEKQLDFIYSILYSDYSWIKK